MTFVSITSSGTLSNLREGMRASLVSFSPTEQPNFAFINLLGDSILLLVTLKFDEQICIFGGYFSLDLLAGSKPDWPFDQLLGLLNYLGPQDSLHSWWQEGLGLQSRDPDGLRHFFVIVLVKNFFKGIYKEG